MPDNVEIPVPNPELVISQLTQMMAEKDHQIAILRAALLVGETRDDEEAEELSENPLANVVTFDAPEEVTP